MGEALLTPSFPFGSILSRLHLQESFAEYLREVLAYKCGWIGAERLQVGLPLPPGPCTQSGHPEGLRGNPRDGVGARAGRWVLARRLR